MGTERNYSIVLPDDEDAKGLTEVDDGEFYEDEQKCVAVAFVRWLVEDARTITVHTPDGRAIEVDALHYTVNGD